MTDGYVDASQVSHFETPPATRQIVSSDNRPSRIYRPDNLHAAYQLNWSLSLFPQQLVPPSAEWLGPLNDAIEPANIRILEFRESASGALQFLLSTKPLAAPHQLIREIKGRLQHLIRDTSAHAFRRNYRIESVGTVRVDVVEIYVRGQLNHHFPEGISKAANGSDLQIARHEASPAIRHSSHGQYLFNLHLVLCRMAGRQATDSDVIEAIRTMIRHVCRAKNYLLLNAGLLPDHLHLVLGLPVETSPLDAALAFLNNLAYVEGMEAVYRYGFYAGTCGAYDLGAIRKHIR